jgi:hypothetical protein
MPHDLECQVNFGSMLLLRLRNTRFIAAPRVLRKPADVDHHYCMGKLRRLVSTMHQLTSIAYNNGFTTVGSVTYTYDAVGRRTNVSGSLAAFTLPAVQPEDDFRLIPLRPGATVVGERDEPPPSGCVPCTTPIRVQQPSPGSS